jgi:hypothetical protein
LRRLVADEELLRRRAAGEGLRTLAADYGVAHTTLGRYLKRPEVARELREVRRSLRAERRAAAVRQAAERRLEREVRRRAKEQEALARELARDAAVASLRRRRRRHPYAAWLDEQDGRRPLTRADLRSRSDERAEEAVVAGGGIEGVLEATGLRTRGNVLRVIDPAILVRAFANDAAASAAAAPERARLRRLVPDRELVRRRAEGETLRLLASDYGVAHTTLARYFARPEVARQLRAVRRRVPAL